MLHWQSLTDFLAMGTHGPYVWGSVGVMALLMVAEPVLLRQGRKKLVERLKRQYRAERCDARNGSQSTFTVHPHPPTATGRSKD